MAAISASRANRTNRTSRTSRTSRMSRALGSLALCVACLALGACGSAPRESFYTLNPVAPPSLAQNRQAAASYSIAVGPVHVPEIVDRPQFVVRRGANRVEVLEQQRWAQPLQAEIAQAIATGLAERLPQARISFGAEAPGRNADYRIAVDVKRFEAVPGKEVVVQSIWTIRTATAKTPLVRQSTFREAASGGGYDALAAAFARAVARTAGDIAETVSSLEHGGAPH